ncbi:tetraacyldisaccharide 4'-kinase [Dokdonia sp. Hel_I_53]|uniref:tetraacyldisaccharide 4'-kinase n=1 Tax=Dokdonia sp. Hel_I_53 TaxID=1566287 RepID=UPI00119C6D41|nr:tetraacyldisaccharide 4'-kinase [Dokdonia sp. Hel_I_53]TVZ52098.1 lipid-A-disaccharide kinase [Dokdonia sp. Hel_I_53]
MRKLRLLLFPFSIIYYVVTLLRNRLYNSDILSSKKYDLPIICVGNLSVGGTGKSPMTEYIIRLLVNDSNVATLSRGYGRHTKGYRDVSPSDPVRKVGDEPLQFAQKFKELSVAVCEDRQLGIETLLTKENKPDIILLDDAFQHRKVEAGFNVLLTAYGDLYCDDYLLPAGNLREPKSGAKRAQVIVVTKCPDTLTIDEEREIKNKLDLSVSQKLFFSKITYDAQVFSTKGGVQLNSLKTKKVTLVTGIANPSLFVQHIALQGVSFTHKQYKDHHNFSKNELEELEELECILTTEKDYVRLRPMLKKVKLFYLPIKIELIKDAALFDAMIYNCVREEKR